MTIRDQMLAIARGEIGVTEYAGRKTNERIIEYHASTSLHATSDEIPWCASFINWVCRYAGVKGTGSAMARSFALWGVSTKNPHPGDVVVFSRGSDGVSGHVGLFVSRTPASVLVLGGNQDDTVKLKKYPRFQVLAYRTLG